MADPTTTALADPARLTARLRLSSANADAADALARASARFISEVGYSPLLVNNDVVTLDGRGTSVLLLPAGPVVSVASVVLSGTTLVAGTDYSLSTRLGALARGGYYGWPLGFGNVVVTYSHGYAPTALPGDIGDAVLEQAEAIYRARAGVKSSTMGPQAVTFDGIGKTQRWSECIARYQRERVSPA